MTPEEKARLATLVWSTRLEVFEANVVAGLLAGAPMLAVVWFNDVPETVAMTEFSLN